MRLRYLGTGTVGIEGVGEVSTGGLIEVPEATAAALLAEQPQHFEAAGAGGETAAPSRKTWVKEAPAEGAADAATQPHTRRGR